MSRSLGTEAAGGYERAGESRWCRRRRTGGAGEDQLEPISWDEWFQKFDDDDLAFLYQEEKASGEDSTFFKLVSR